MSYSSFKAKFKGHLLCEALLDHAALAPFLLLPTDLELPMDTPAVLDLTSVTAF